MVFAQNLLTTFIELSSWMTHLEVSRKHQSLKN